MALLHGFPAFAHPDLVGAARCRRLTMIQRLLSRRSTGSKVMATAPPIRAFLRLIAFAWIAITNVTIAARIQTQRKVRFRVRVLGSEIASDVMSAEVSLESAVDNCRDVRTGRPRRSWMMRLAMRCDVLCDKAGDGSGDEQQCCPEAGASLRLHAINRDGDLKQTRSSWKNPICADPTQSPHGDFRPPQSRAAPEGRPLIFPLASEG